MRFDSSSPEPNRSLVLVDGDGDYWWYSEVPGDAGWQFSSGDDKIGTAHVTTRRSWEDLARVYGEDGLSVLGKLARPGKVQPMAPTDSWFQNIVPTAPEPGFTVKDSGVREEYANGFVRDTEEGKYDYSRVLAIPGLHLIPVEALERWGAHMVKGAEKYGEDNWRQARGPIAIARFLRSLCRHVVQFVRGDVDEDHGAAIMFNVAAAMITPKED